MSRHETRAAIAAAADDLERLRAKHREQMLEECISLPFPWKWLDAGPEAVIATTGTVTLALVDRGTLRLHVEGLRDGDCLEPSLIGLMGDQLAIEQEDRAPEES